MKRTIATIVASLIGFGLFAHVVENTGSVGLTVEDDPDEEYHRHEILGFTVHISAEDMNDRPEMAEAALWMTRSKLQRIIEVVPLNKVKLLRTVEIWINDNYDESDELCGWACYVHNQHHGTSEFLNERQGEIIIRDLDFLIESAWCCSHGTYLHEMAHAYHNQFLEDGYDNQRISDEYEKARDSGDYDNNRVLYPWWDDQYRKHYGMTDDREFFATMTETYFLGAYPTFPHNVRDLYDNNRSVYQLIVDAWLSDNISGGIVSFSGTTETEMPAQLNGF